MAEFKANTLALETQREKKNNELVRRLAPEGMVLLKNDGTLPLGDKLSEIALYGAGVRFVIKGGTGSGDVNTRSVVNIEQGFENAGVKVVTKAWLDDYDAMNKQAVKDYIAYKRKLLADGVNFLDVLLGEGFKNPLHQEITVDEASKYKADTALYVLTRNSGEGADRENKENDYKISQVELRSIKNLTQVYSKVIVALNIGGAVETKELMALDVNAILLMSQPGNFAGNILADVVLGKSYPSGKLTTTWAREYSDYAFSDEFGKLSGNLDDSYYKEDIYVGYRYFDTFDVTPEFYFGYGLSYAKFDYRVTAVKNIGTKIVIETEVTNTDNKHAGKEIIQVYVSKPKGKLDQPYKVLAGFAKTTELKPGQKTVVTIDFSMEDIASYDEDTASWILEDGAYHILVGNSSQNVSCVAKIELKGTAVVEKSKNLLKPMVEFTRLKNHKEFDFSGQVTDIVLEAGQFKTQINSYGQNKFSEILKNTKEGAKEKDFANINNVSKVSDTAKSGEKLTLKDVRENKISLEELVMDLTIEEMCYLVVGSGWENMYSGQESIIGDAAMQVPGAAGETTSRLADRGVPNLIMADGPAGLRLTPEFGLDEDGNMLGSSMAIPFFEEIFGNPEKEEKPAVKHYYQYCTAIPIATMLAQTWNEQLIEELGDMIGGEMEEFGIQYWLAPGMNIHRNVLCGRNFEYYSEDPLLTGRCAAAMTRGVGKHPNATTTIKHFALNNQEDNRLLTCSNASERAIREIYLKGFEICVKNSAPRAIMSSYNLINGVHAANNSELLKDILRSEWGYDGLVMTDWGTTGFEAIEEIATDSKYGNSLPSGCMVAGNDIIMPGFKKDMEQIKKALNDGDDRYHMTLDDLRYCARNVLKSVLELS